MEKDIKVTLKNKSYIFREKSLKIGDVEIKYSDISTFNYRLTHRYYTILKFAIIKFFNRVNVDISFELDNGKKIGISKSVYSPFWFILATQRELEREYKQFVELIDQRINPVVAPKVARQIVRNGSMKIGNILEVTPREVKLLLGRKSKSLPVSQFKKGVVHNDLLQIIDNDGNVFSQITLKSDNTAILPSVLEILKNNFKN